MEATAIKLENHPVGLEPFDKVWAVGESAMRENPSPFPRVNRFRKFANERKFTVDHERACLVTEAYDRHRDKSQIVKVAESLRHA